MKILTIANILIAVCVGIIIVNCSNLEHVALNLDYSTATAPDDVDARDEQSTEPSKKPDTI